jgi:hypothetical protein
MVEAPVSELRIANWTTYQHYKERRPPWVKLHVQLLDNVELAALPTTTQLVALKLLLVAAKTENRIPDGGQILAGWLSLDTRYLNRALRELVEIGYLERVLSTGAEDEQRQSRGRAEAEQRQSENGVRNRARASRGKDRPGRGTEQSQKQPDPASAVLAEPDGNASAVLAPRARSREAEQELRSSLPSKRTTGPRADLPDQHDQDTTPLGRLITATGATGSSAATLRRAAHGRPEHVIARTLESLRARPTPPDNPVGWAISAIRSIDDEQRRQREPELG